MRKVLAIVALIAALSVSAGCKKEDKPVAEFQDKILSVGAHESVELTMNLDIPATSDFSVPVEFTSTAAKGTEYTVSAEAFSFSAGSTSAKITLIDNGMKGASTVTVKILENAYVEVGTNYTCIITRDLNEALICSFKSAKEELMLSTKAKVTITVEGEKQGSEFMALDDIAIPFTLTGALADAITSDSDYFIVKKGTNTADLFFEVNKAKASDLSSPEVVVKLGSSEYCEIIVNDSKKDVTLTVMEDLTPSKLIGTWEFDRTYAIDELELWFMEYEDDPDLLPTHNEGFTLTFAENEAGEITVTPGGTGDLLNYFRNSTISLATPINFVNDENTVIVGSNQVKEYNMFMHEDDGLDNPAIFTYFVLSSANRAFSADDEELGESIIAFRINEDGELQMQLRDYDCPPFGEMWWDDEKFDGEMFGFASVFTKAE